MDRERYDVVLAAGRVLAAAKHCKLSEAPVIQEGGSAVMLLSLSTWAPRATWKADAGPLLDLAVELCLTAYVQAYDWSPLVEVQVTATRLLDDHELDAELVRRAEQRIGRQAGMQAHADEVIS